MTHSFSTADAACADHFVVADGQPFSDLATRPALGRAPTGWVVSAAFSPDGSRIVTASRDTTARVWDSRLQNMSVKDTLVEACARLAGIAKLTREEMRLAGCPESMLEIEVCQ